jgi:hypothetical protein
MVRVAAAMIAAAVFISPAAPAAALELTASGGYQKPLAHSHPDQAPSVPGSTSDVSGPGGAAPAAPPVPARDGSGCGSTHADAGTAGTYGVLSGSGASGANSISFKNFDDGDMVVVTDPTSITGHSGLFDSRFYDDIHSYAVLSANVQPHNGVQREQCLKYRAYDRAYALWVPSESNHGVAARNFAYKQMGKPYSVLASKTDLRSFYCSKLDWAAWRYTSGLDLDADGGFWVWPVDLVYSRYTSVFGYWG